MRALTCVKHLPPCKNFILTLGTWLYWILICFNYWNRKVEKSIGQCSLNPYSWTEGSVIGNQEEWSPRENRWVGAETHQALSHSQAMLASSLVCFMHLDLMFWCGIQGPPLTLLSLSDQTICIPVPPLDSSSHQLKKSFILGFSVPAFSAAFPLSFLPCCSRPQSWPVPAPLWICLLCECTFLASQLGGYFLQQSLSMSPPSWV